MAHKLRTCRNDISTMAFAKSTDTFKSALNIERVFSNSIRQETSTSNQKQICWKNGLQQKVFGIHVKNNIRTVELATMTDSERAERLDYCDDIASIEVDDARQISNLEQDCRAYQRHYG